MFFRPVGSAPLLRQTKFKISSSQRFQSIADFLGRQLATAAGPPASPAGAASPDREAAGGPVCAGPVGGLYLYVNSSFAPAMDELVGNLYACFAVDATLIINYSMTPAWG